MYFCVMGWPSESFQFVAPEVVLLSLLPCPTVGPLNPASPGGGRLQPVLMRPNPPAICQNLGGRGQFRGGSAGGGSIMVGHRYWMPPPRQFQPMFQVLSTINCYATSSR